jgi:hypothetical protein
MTTEVFSYLYIQMKSVMGEELFQEEWSSYDNLFRCSCNNCHGVRRKTSVYITKTLAKNGYFHLSRMSFR